MLQYNSKIEDWTMKISIDGKEISEDFCRHRTEFLRRQNPGVPDAELKRKAAAEIIRNALLQDEAARRFPEVSEELVGKEMERMKRNSGSEDEFREMCRRSNVTEAAIRDDMRNSLRINLLMGDLTRDIPPTPPQIVEEYYRRDADLSTKPAEVHAAHIVKRPDPQTPMKTLKEMCEIRKKLLDGAKFSDLADKHSSCNDKGGDLGYFQPGKMVEEFETVVFSMGKGEISPVFKSPFGYHIATVYDIRPERRLSLEECREAVEAKIAEKMREHAIDEWAEKEKAKMKISVTE